MVNADSAPTWLRALADAAAVLLLLELIVLLLVVTGLTFALALGANWLRKHVIPVLNTTMPRARQALEVANAGTEQVTRGVAEVYGIRRGVETGLQVMLHGAQPGRHAAPGVPGNAGDARSVPTGGGDGAIPDPERNDLAEHAG
jgi:hypothetical protein